MKKILNTIYKITNLISGWAVFLMVIVCLIDAFGRFIGHPLVGATDLVQILMVLAIFPALGYIQSQDGNSRVEIVYGRLSPKKKAICNLFNSVIGFGITVILGYRLMVRAISVFQKHNYASMTLQIDLAPFLLIASIGVFILSIQFIVDFLDNIKVLSSKEENK